MAIRLALSLERDLRGDPALFVMTSTLPDGVGLGAQRRTFHFAGDLTEALAPTGLEPGSLRAIANDLEQGREHMLEITNEQAWRIGMLPHRDGLQWVLVRIHKVTTGDGSPRYCESYHTDDQTVEGNPLEETLASLETRMGRFVALDWRAIEEQLEQQDAVSTVLHLPDETVVWIFSGEV